MRYTDSSPWISTGLATAQQIQDWFDHERGPAGADILKVAFKKPPRGIGDAIIKYGQMWNLNTDLIAGQLDLECAGWQSQIARDKLNPGGYGAENDAAYAKAATFETAEEGIRVCVAHLALYVHGRGEWEQYDNRASLVINSGWAGVVRTPTDLEQKWAWSPEDRYQASDPDNRYGDKIASRTNTLMDNFDAEAPVVTRPNIIPGDNIYGVPFSVSLIPSKNDNRPGDKLRRYSGATIHDTGNPTVGANAEMHRQFTHNGGGKYGVSFTLVVDDHEIIQLLPLDEVGYHGGSTGCNYEKWGIETCVNSDGDYTKTLHNTAKLVARLWELYPETHGMVSQHNACNGKNCPAKLRAGFDGGWDGFLNMVSDADTLGEDTPIPDRGEREFPTGYTIRGRIRDCWESVEAVKKAMPLIGLPLGPEVAAETPDGRSVVQQEFERVILEYDTTLPYPWDVTALPRKRLPSDAPELRDILEQISDLLLKASAL